VIYGTAVEITSPAPGGTPTKFGRARERGAAEIRSVSNAGRVSVARARFERSATVKDGLRRNGYVGIVSDVMSPMRYEAAMRTRHTRICFCWSGGGVLEGAVEHELGRGAEAG